MQIKVKKIGVVLLTLVFMLSITALATAAPPEHARGNGPPAHANSIQHTYTHQHNHENGLPPGLQGKGIPPGLQDKGGLPPGLHGRDVLPPGIQMRFVDAVQEDEEERAFGLHVEGSEYIIIPGDGEEPAEETYTAVFVDEEGAENTVEASWEVENGLDEGISINEEGVLEVESGVDPATITVKATYTRGEDEEAEDFTASLDVDLYYQEIASVEIEGQKYVDLLAEEFEGGYITLEYTATVRDQKGEAIAGEEVDWEINWENFDLDGDAYTANGNELTVEIPNETGEFTITATSATDDTVYNNLTVTVYEAEAASVKIDGTPEIEIPAAGDGDLAADYTASVLDQYEQTLVEDATVEWWLVEGEGEEVGTTVEGVTLDENGNLTVTSNAEEGSFWIRAVYDDNGDVDGYFEVELVKND